MAARRANARSAQQARPRSPSLREQWSGIWTGLKQFLAWLGRMLLVLALLGGIAWVGQTFWQRLQMPLAQIEVVGANDEVSAQWVQRQLRPWIGTDFWQLNLAAARQKLSTNPWIAQVDLVRRWPNALIVQLAIHHPIARWQGVRLLDDKGQVFQPPAATMPNDLPVLNGPDGRAWALWERYLTLKPVLKGVGLNLIGVMENSRGSQELLLQHGCVIRLGQEQIESRLQRFLDVYPKTLVGKMDRVAAVDLRYSNGFAVKWRVDAQADAAKDKHPK